jgi:rRNA maturation endonuclease Nob1
MVAITWFLIFRGSKQEPDDIAHYIACRSCQRSVQSEWRLCPYCGAELRAWTPPDGSTSRNADDPALQQPGAVR